MKFTNICASLIIFTHVTAAYAQQASTENTLKYSTVVNISDYQGSTFFSLMYSQIKPALDKYALDGQHILSSSDLNDRLDKVDYKVLKGALSAAGNKYKLLNIADKLNSSNSKINFYNLPDAISQAGGAQGRFDLSTFYALMSGGGVAVKIDQNNVTYNVNYGTGETDKDEMTGRSFGESFGRLALDASDKHYLEMLEKYVQTSGTNVQYFYQSLLEILLNNDTQTYKRITKDGQAVATDFIAVYIAEQDRHLMANLKNHDWDTALLEVSLLSALAAGQDKIKVMYNGELTEQTYKQAHGCSVEPKKAKSASLIDYWQFSKSDDLKSCKRSGINVTRRDFRKLGKLISNYERKNNPAIYYKVTRHFDSKSGNLFQDLSEYLINYKTPRRMNAEQLELAADFTAFLMQVRADATEISK